MTVAPTTADALQLVEDVLDFAELVARDPGIVARHPRWQPGAPAGSFPAPSR